MRGRTKDFKGCLECRARKVKCDGTRPHCKRCLRIGKSCPGYLLALVWVSPNHETSEAQGRGGPCPYSTWRGWPTLTVDEVESLLTQLNKSPFSMRSSLNPVNSLFSVLDIHSMEVNPTLRIEVEAGLHHSLDSLGLHWDNTSRYLFHHYVNHVSPQMMPFAGSYNPWTTHYPCLALENESIRHALLGQAAAHWFHLKHQTPNMEIRALRHRVAALAHLRSLLSTRDGGSFEVKVAAILSLIMADVYFGLSEGWRSHIFGAVEIAVSSVSESPWLVSEMAWLTAQSLCLLCLRAKIDGNLGKTEDNCTYDKSELVPAFLVPVSRRSDYGFTIGTSQALASCLGDCAAVMARRYAQNSTASLRAEVELLTQKLLSMTLSSSSLDVAATSARVTSRLYTLHIHIFALGLLICLQRRTLNPRPSELLIYTNLLFEGVAAFRSLANMTANGQQRFCSPTIWPVFHAAVELYRPEDQYYAREVWLSEIEKTAIGNRQQIRSVVEKVWLTRQERSKLLRESSFVQFGMTICEESAAGRIIVDWIETAEEMGLDLLLI